MSEQVWHKTFKMLLRHSTLKKGRGVGVFCYMCLFLRFLRPRRQIISFVPTVMSGSVWILLYIHTCFNNTWCMVYSHITFTMYWNVGANVYVTCQPYLLLWLRHAFWNALNSFASFVIHDYHYILHYFLLWLYIFFSLSVFYTMLYVPENDYLTDWVYAYGESVQDLLFLCTM